MIPITTVRGPLRCFCITQDRFFSIFKGGPLLEPRFLWKFALKISTLGVKTGEWASIRAWASYRDFTVLELGGLA